MSDRVRRPAFQFYPADWRKDPELRACSIAARGLWIDMLCIMHEAEPYGHLVVRGCGLTDEQLARMVGETPRAVKAMLQELEDAGVYSRQGNGMIYSRRMVRDERVRNARAAGGKESLTNPNVPRPKQGKDGGKDTFQGSFDASLGGSPSSSSSSSEKTPCSPPEGDRPPSTDKPKRVTATRGSRSAPADFAPDTAIAAEFGVDPVWAEHEMGAFRDWEFKQPKTNWTATWRNWLRCAAADGRPQALPSSNGSGAAGVAYPGDEWKLKQERDAAALSAWEAETEAALKAQPQPVRAEVKREAEAKCAALQGSPRYDRFLRSECLAIYGRRIRKPRPEEAPP